MHKTIFAAGTLLGFALAWPALAQGSSPEQFLMQARTAVQAHHAMTALMAVNNAENELLRSGAAEEQRSTRDVGEPEVIRQIGRAREAIQQRHWQQAETYINDAMSHPSTSQAVNPGDVASDSSSAGTSQK
jgi:hypothetical protein